LISVGSPYKASGYAYQTYRRCFGNDESSVLVWNAASAYMNPTLDHRVVERALEEDYQAASVEYAIQPGLFREDLEQFVSRELVESLVIPGRKELPPVNGTWYAAFIDVSGGRGDPAALAIAHRQDRKVILDCVEEYKAPHNPYEVTAKMVATLRRYHCDRAISDAYAAEWVRTAFASHGIDVRRATTTVWHEGTQVKNRVAKPKSVLYAELLPRLTSGEVELLDNEHLISQLCALQRRTRSGGRDAIDHPPGGHDDCANVLAGVCDAVQQRVVVAGSFEHGEPASVSSSPLDLALRQFDMDAQVFAQEQEGFIAGEDHDHQATWNRAMAEVGRAAYESVGDRLERARRIAKLPRRYRPFFQ
jgi:hypothetical protein